MATNDVTTYLKYANIQMAAEAFIEQVTREEKSLQATLIEGNKRSSLFPELLATDFAAHWKVVATQANTATGFSGTLFECISADEEKGYTVGEQVLSFRSTEFIDDAVRDNKATNELELKKFGFAFGQIADMQKLTGHVHHLSQAPQQTLAQTPRYQSSGNFLC
jgi:hypothetical protein